MRTSVLKWSAPLGAVLAIAGCSLINAFDEVVSFQDSNLGGMAGAASGGSGGMDASGGMGGEIVQGEPGLVIVGGNVAGADVLVALSPQTGEEVGRLEGKYAAVAHEAERDLWFLIQEDEVQVARFNRARNQWSTEGTATVVAPLDPLHVFALNGNLAILGDNLELHVFDTSNLGSIESKGVAEYPAGLWGAVGVPNNGGGEIHVASLDCVTDPMGCLLQLTRIQLDSEGVQVIGPVTLTSTGVVMTSAVGSITYDPTTNQVIVVEPDFLNSEGIMNVHVLPRTHALPSTTFPLTQRFNQPRWTTFDPCQNVLYAMVPPVMPMVAGVLEDNADRTEMAKAVGLNGQGMVFEPYTRSLLLLQKSGDNFTVDAWSIVGTSLQPDIRKRLSDWSPPPIRPEFAVAAMPKGVICE